MTKETVYMREFEKLNELFKNVDESKKQLAEGLIKSAAFLFSENSELEEKLKITGMVKFHPDNPMLQKDMKAAERYLKNLNSYERVIKTLNVIISQNNPEEEDDLADYEDD